MLAAVDWACDGVAYPRLVWLSSTLLPRLLRWAAEPAASQFKSTLSLLPVEKYGGMYQQLKEKYRTMVKVGRGGTPALFWMCCLHFMWCLLTF